LPAGVLAQQEQEQEQEGDGVHCPDHGLIAREHPPSRVSQAASTAITRFDHALVDPQNIPLHVGCLSEIA
jgi:hypothetical protein